MSKAGERPRTGTHAGVIAAFIACAHEFPDHIALIQDDRRLTYAELDRRSASLASALAARGIGRGDRVQIVFGRSIEFIIALIGVTRAGAAYVPIDPKWPEERRVLLERLTNPALVIVEGDAKPREAEPGLDEPRTRSSTSTGIGLDHLLNEGDDAIELGHAHESNPSDPIYIMFTSGTTGEPKGVVVPHRAVARLV